jgi:signal transduction histidine kinase
MSFRLRIAAWTVVSCTLLIAVMMVSAYLHLEEELRKGRVDQNHPQNPNWVLHNSYAEAEIEDILGEIVNSWLWTAVPMIGLSLFAGLLLARRSLWPVKEINRQLAEMRPESLHGAITIPEADPAIADLAVHLNQLLDKAGTAYQEMAEFSARVAHELRTPLMLLRMRVEKAPEGIPPAFQEDLQDELTRLARFVERSLLAAKAEQGALTPVLSPLSLSELVRDVTEDYQLLAGTRSLAMTLALEQDIRVHGDPDLLRQALHGLLENSIRYATSVIAVSCRSQEGTPVLEISNDLDGTTAPTAGLGLGLRLVRGICRASAIRFEVRESDHDFTVLLHFNNKSNLTSP